jgi:hypothetical protein
MLKIMKLKIWITIIFMIIVCGCGEKTTNRGGTGEVIHLNPHDAAEYVNLSEIADSIKCIKLQPAPDDIIGRIRRIVVGKKYIYVVDVSQQMLFVFDKTGKFVSKLDKEGEGPGEYIVIGHIFIDDSEKYIEIIDTRKDVKFKYANISFEWIETSPLPDIRHNMCRRNDGFYYFATQQIDNVIDDKKTNAGLVILDNENNIKTLFDKNIETNNSYFSVNEECFAQNDKNELFVSIMYDNTFYQLKDGNAYPVFTVDFGKYGINNEYVGSMSTKEQKAYIRNLDGLASFPILNINNSNIMSFSYFFRQKNEERAFFNEKDIRQYIKINDKVYHTKEIRNDLTSFPDRLYISSSHFYCAHDVWCEDYLVDVIKTDLYFPNDTKIYVEGLGEVTSDEEIIVVLMKLKK